MNTTIQMIKSLRQRTGVGPMFCKEALIACGNNEDEAVEYLKAKGLETVKQREMTQEPEIRVLAAAKENRLALAAVSCESDFVADSVELKKALNNLVQKLLNIEHLSESLREKLAVEFAEETYFLKERIEIINSISVAAKGKLSIYNHYNGKVACGFWTENATDPKKLEALGLHIAASTPWFVQKSEIPEDTQQKWLKEFTENLKDEGKPEKLIGKIAIGQLNKRITQKCLFTQKFLMDETVTVEKWLKFENIHLNSFQVFPANSG